MQAVVTRNIGDYARSALDEIDGVEVKFMETTGPMERGDVVHRPFQVWNAPDLALLRDLGDRLVVTQLDLIAYRSPSYHRSQEEWERYRSLTRRSLAIADRVVFLSDHARRDACLEDLVEPDRATVVRPGVDHRLGLTDATDARPTRASRLAEGDEFVLCIGTDLRHKNRPFALRVFQQLRACHSWEGWLVLAGPHVEFGSSAPEEASFLAAHPDLASRCLDLGPVSEAEKAWLLAGAKAVLYPTLHEGFGFVPFEAASHSTPCMWAAGTALSEILPDADAGVAPWSAKETADALIVLLQTTPFASNTSNPSPLPLIACVGTRLQPSSCRCIATPAIARHRRLALCTSLEASARSARMASGSSGRAVRSRPTSSDHCSRWPPIRG